MATTEASPLNEPTPEFETICRQIIDEWEAGSLPSMEAIQRLSLMSREAMEGGNFANQGRAEHIMGFLQHYLGNLARSIEHYETARRLWQRVGNPRRVATMDLNQGENYRFKGEFSRARRLYRSAYEAAAQLGELDVQTLAICNEGLVLLSMGDYRAARVALQEALQLAERWTPEMRDKEGLLTEVEQGLAKLDLEAKNPQEAWTHALAALHYAEVTKQHITLGMAWRILGDVVTALGTSLDEHVPSNPDECYRVAVEYFREVKAEAEVGRTLFAQASSLVVRGKRRPAAQMFKEAMVVFTRLGMTDDAAKAADAQLRALS